MDQPAHPHPPTQLWAQERDRKQSRGGKAEPSLLSTYYVLGSPHPCSHPLRQTPQMPHFTDGETEAKGFLS